MRDFMILRWPPVAKEREARLRARAAILEASGYERLLDWRGVLILARRGGLDFPAVVAPDGWGVLFGMAFRRGAAAAGRIASLDASVAVRWAESGGEALVGEVWGAFAAFLVDKGRDHLHVVPAPTGAVPLFHAELDGGHAVFSDVEVYARMGGPLDVEGAEVEAFIRYPNRFSIATALRDVRRIFPGTCLTLPREGSGTRLLWRPADPDHTRVDDVENGMRLRSALEETCAALVTSRPHTLHRLSGGLDSSVVLSVLARTAPAGALTAVHDYPIGHGEGDERASARRAAQHLGVGLIENAIDPVDVDYSRMLDMPLAPSPAPTLLTWANAQPSICGAGIDGALATSGQGGDHVFYRGRGAAAPADVWRDGLGLGAFWREALRSARRSRLSVWSLLAEAVRTGALGRAFDLSRHLRREGQSKAMADATAAEHATLPWLEDHRLMPPGVVHRLMLLIDAQTYFGPTQLAARFSLAPPLLFEPVIEAAFRVPSYAMCVAGLDRGLARMTFAAELPAEIVYRRAKGQTTRFVAAILRRNRDFLMDVLCGGRLVERELVDADRVREMILSGVRADAVQPTALTPLISAEMWLRSVERAKAKFVGASAGPQALMA